MTLEPTPKIVITVNADYVPQQSSPTDNHFFFSYSVEIQNESQTPVTLLSRRWEITDGNGNKQHSQGVGVVGEQPVIAPGQSYTYTSRALLKTPVGSMQGDYLFATESGNQFSTPIPAFRLADLALLN